MREDALCGLIHWRIGTCMNVVLGDYSEPSLASLMDFHKERDKIDPGTQFTLFQRVDSINPWVLG